MKETLATIGLTAILATGGVIVADEDINPYEDKGTHYEVGISNNAVNIDKNTNEVQLTRWDSKESITIKPVGDYLPSDRDLLSKVREAQSTDGKSTFIIEPIEGAINLDTILKERPEINGKNYQQFYYTIAGCEDYDFSYQLPLTDEEIAQGDIQPEDITGSYAVYHKTLKDNEFMTGKAFHIKRPKISDDKENWVWGELGFDPKTCTITVYVPHDFLDNAVYPVRVDPTLGYTSMGASNSTNALNVMFAFVATSTENGTVDSIAMGIDGNGAGTVNAKGVLLNFVTDANTVVTDGVAPPVLLPASASGSFTTATYSSKPSIVNGSGYAIAAIADGTVRYFYDNIGTTQGWSDVTNSYTSPANTGPTSASTRRVSLYINYTASGGATGGTGSVGNTRHRKIFSPN